MHSSSPRGEKNVCAVQNVPFTDTQCLPFFSSFFNPSFLPWCPPTKVSPIPVSEGKERFESCNLSDRPLPLHTCVGILHLSESSQAQAGPLSPSSGHLLSSIPYLWKLSSGGIQEPTKFNQQIPCSAEDYFF